MLAGDDKARLRGPPRAFHVAEKNAHDSGDFAWDGVHTCQYSSMCEEAYVPAYSRVLALTDRADLLKMLPYFRRNLPIGHFVRRFNPNIPHTVLVT
jgi:hypothetical protein